MTFRFLIFVALALGATATAHAGMNADTPYTQRGKTDFDTTLQLLNPYGTWAKVDGKWAFTPREHMVPYTEGRWIYTEFGWVWQGRAPHSWATEHYGYWKRGADKVWAWYPGPFWLPQIVEIRATSHYIGWRSAEVDDQGSFVEAPIDRYGKEDEWIFVTLAQFANPITPDIVAKPDIAKQELEDSTDCRHTYLTYREIDRPGPHPADFADLCKDGGMLAPLMAADQRAAQEEAAAAPAPATNSPAAHMTGTNGPSLIGAQIDPSADTRKVKYWVTMSLPTYWTKPPDDAKPDQIYLYRPDYFQDNDGIERRITLWFNPKERGTLKDLLGSSASLPKSTPSASGTPATTAIPAASASNPFASPLNDAPRPAGAKPATNARPPAKRPPPAAPCPTASRRSNNFPLECQPPA